MNSGSQGSEIKVTVKAFGGLRELIGSSALSVLLPREATLADLLDELYRRLPTLRERLDTGLKDGYVNILLNGRNVRFLDGTATPLPEEAVVAFLPPVGGG
jgi:molybdopterin synthase sulfur carrier subunit